MSYTKQIGDMVGFLERNPELLPKKETFVIPFFNRKIKNKVFPGKSFEILETVTKKNPWTIKELAKRLQTKVFNIERDILILKKYKLIKIEKLKGDMVIRRNRDIFVFPLDNTC